MSLDDLREQLSGVDRRLVKLIAERQRLVTEIGRHKRDAGAATRDYAREKDVLDMGRAQAAELGIDPDRLTTSGRGSSEPAVPNTSAENRARNRRIQFIFERD